MIITTKLNPLPLAQSNLIIWQIPLKKPKMTLD